MFTRMLTFHRKKKKNDEMRPDVVKKKQCIDIILSNF